MCMNEHGIGSEGTRSVSSELNEAVEVVPGHMTSLWARSAQF